jgi:proliferating cell nuclear antigen
MVYILELKTTQAAAMKIVTDAINSLLTDANFDFYPYYIEENDNEDEDSDNKSDNLESDNDNDYESESDEADSSDDSDSEQYIKKKVTKKNQKNKEKETKKSSNKKEEKTPENEGGDEVEKKKTIGGVVLKEVNKTGKILVYMRLDADKFDVYKYNYHKKKLTLGIDIGNLLKCLKCMSHFDTMSWLVDDDDINKLIVVLESVERKEKKTFKLNLMDIEEETYDITPIQFPYSITLPSPDFHKYCKDMSGSTDKMEIKATSKKLFFSGKGEIGNVEFEVGETNGGLQIVSTTSNTNEIVQGLFELKFLLIFTKCTNLCNQVTLFLKNDYPIIVTYQIAALGEIKLVLSPSKSD